MKVFMLLLSGAAALWAGGLVAAGEKEPAPPPAFTVRELDGRWSLMTPAGQPFFSTGVCLVTQGTSRGDYDTENPACAAWQHYPDAGAWADATAWRLKGWGFSTIGAWSDFATLRASPEATLHFAPVLHIGSTAGAPVRWKNFGTVRALR